MAIIILSGADFSTNRVRKINIFNGYSATTKSVFNMTGIVEDENNVYQRAVNDFVNSLVDAGLWGNGKISALCLPFLSELGTSGVTTAQKNIINGQNFFATSVEGSLSVYNHGLKAIPDAEVVRINIMDYCSTGNIHLAAYNITSEPKEYTTSSGKAAKVVFGPIGYLMGLYKQNEHKPSFVYKPGNEVNGDSNYAENTCMLSVSIPSDGYPHLYVNGQETVGLNNTPNGQSINNNPKFGCIETNYTDDTTRIAGFYCKSSFGLLSCGGSLTAEEMGVYTEATNTLMEIVKNM